MSSGPGNGHSMAARTHARRSAFHSGKSQGRVHLAASRHGWYQYARQDRSADRRLSMTAHDLHGHDHKEASELSETELRVRALQTILVEKGYTNPAALDAIVETYETKIGPHIGTRIVARAWIDPEF